MANMVSVDVNKEIRRAVDTGKIVFGQRSTERNILNRDCKMVILSANAPKATVEKTRHLANIAGLRVLDFNGNARQLGAVCGKPFVVSMLAVLDFGKSKAFEIVEEKQTRQKARRKA